MKKDIISFFFFLLLLFFQPFIARGNSASNLQTEPVILDKSGNNISEKARAYLNLKKTPLVKVWVFFNDKGIFDKTAFNRLASRIKINEHTLQRRARAAVDRVVFADLPVNKAYIETITRLGASHRRTSRWLNAASFEIPLSRLNEITVLPFINKIQPVADFVRQPEITGDNDILPPDKNLTGMFTFDYGLSLTQVNMLNVPAVHDLGYNGQGIIICLMDSGFRKTHNAFTQAYSDGRVLDEYDFIFNDAEVDNEPEDDPSAHNHGTYCWSALGGFVSGSLIGPAFGASFLLAKTEDIRSETPVEEDNWVAALEWADSLGADITSTSLGYSDWYSWGDFDGQTAVITMAANTAASLGIIACISAGNKGPNDGTITAPADAFDILAVGAVNSYESIAGFSSRGPTADGRLKPEVCAMGVNTYCANSINDNDFTYKSGTSLACPLIAGAAGVLLSARPEMTPWQIRKALMKAADRAANPDNTYGYGIIDLHAALTFEDICGDVNDDGTLTVQDFEYLVAYLYKNGPRPPFREAADVDYLPGLTNHDAQFLADYFFVAGAYEPGCLPYADTVLPISDDTITISNNLVLPGRNTARVDLRLTAVNDIKGLAFPFSYSCSTSSVYCDSVSFTGSRYAGYVHKYGCLDSNKRKGAIGLINTGETVPQPGEGLLASLYFTLTPSVDTQYILIDTSSFTPGDMPVITRRTSVLEALIPVIQGRGAYVDPVVHVMTSGNDSTGDGHLFNPYATIQKAVVEARNGDTVMVHDGLYQGDNNKTINFKYKRLVIKSQNGPEKTVIDCQGENWAFLINNGDDTTTVIEGFTITNGSSVVVGGIRCESSSSPLIKNCIFSNNAGLGSAIYCNSSSPVIINCTFIHNGTPGLNPGGVVYCTGEATPEIRNCILAFNSPGIAVYCRNTLNPPQLSCTDIYGNADGDWVGCLEGLLDVNGNFSGDPLFCDSLDNNFRIINASPCAPSHNSCGILIGALDIDTGCQRCCFGLAGNSDCSQNDEPDVSDIFTLIEHLYLNHLPLCCPEEADSDGSGGPPDISDITRLIDYLFLSHTPPAWCR